MNTQTDQWKSGNASVSADPTWQNASGQAGTTRTAWTIEQRFGAYRKPTDATIPKYAAIQEKTLELAVLMNELCPNSPEKWTALTQLQLAKMSANAAVAIYIEQ